MLKRKEKTMIITATQDISELPEERYYAKLGIEWKDCKDREIDIEKASGAGVSQVLLAFIYCSDCRASDYFCIL